MMTIVVGLALAVAAFPQDESSPSTPTGGFTIENPDPTTTVVTQSADKVIINWQGLNVGTGETLRFVQPSSTSIALNRVLGSDPSLILGSIEANGRIFLLNPNGILFGQGSCVNVGGLVASTLSIADEDFLSGNYRFFQDPSRPLSYVVNQGSIQSGEFAVLAAPFVENSGSILAAGGKVYMLGSSEVFLDLRGDGLVGYSIGTATGGTVHIRGDALSDVMRAVVNSSGIVEAGAIVERADGVIELVGAEGIVINRGVVSVSGGDGFVALHSAKGTVTSRLSTIEADGFGENSNGGHIYILSEDATFFDGYAYARGGTTGDGGFIEVSGVSRLQFIGYADATAAGGRGGHLLIDPDTLVIANGGPSANDAEVGDGIILFTEGAGATWTISENALEALPGGMNITLEARFRLVMNDLADNLLSLATTAGFTVTFYVDEFAFAPLGDISFNAGDTIQTQGGNIVMDSNVDIGNDADAVNPNGTLVTNGGDVTLLANRPGSDRFIHLIGIFTDGGNVVIEAGRNVTVGTIDAGTGSIAIRADANEDTLGLIAQRPGGVWTADRMVLISADGITRTDGSAVVTDVNRLQVANIGDMADSPGRLPSGRVRIVNQGDLILDADVYAELETDLGMGWGLILPEAVRSNSLVNQTGIAASTEITANNGDLFLNGTVVVASALNPITLQAINGSIVDDGDQTTIVTGEIVVFPNLGATDGLTTINLIATGTGAGMGQIGGPDLEDYVDVGRFGQLNVTAGTNAYVMKVLDLDGEGGAVSTSSIGTFTNGGFVGTLAFVNLTGDITVNDATFANHNDQLILGAVGDLIVPAGGTVSVNAAGTGILLWATNDVLQTGGTVQGGTSSSTGGNRRVEIQADSDIAASLGFGANGVGLINKTGGTLIAGDLVASAATGINFNSFNALRFQATNTISGNIAATDTNTLTLADIDGLTYAVSNAGAGNITIAVSANDLTLAGDVMTGSGTVTLTAARHILDDGDQETEVSTTGDIVLTATTGSIGVYNGLTFAGFVDVGSGFATLTATASGGGAGNGNVLISQVDGPSGPAGLTTTALNVVLTPNAAGTFGLVNYSGALIIGAPISRAGGIILGGNGTLDVDDSIESTASFVVLASTDDVNVNADVTAATRVTIEADSPKFSPDILPDGSGLVDQTAGTISAPEVVVYAAEGITLPTVTAGTLQATNAVSGDIEITESDGVTLADITGLGYAVSNTGGGNITIEVLAGDMLLAGDVIANGGGNIELTAEGSILDDGLQTTAIETTGDITLTATNGSIGAYNGVNFNGFVDFRSGFGSLTADASNGNVFLSQVGTPANLSYTGISITVAPGGDLGLVNLVGNLTIDAPVATGGNIFFGASGNLVVDDSVSSAADTILLAAGGDVTGSGDVSVAAGRLTIAADSALFGSNGDGMIDLDGTLTALELVATAATGINLPDLVVDSLQATNTTSGDITIVDAGDTTLAALTGGPNAVFNPNGDVSIESGGSMTLEADVRSGGDTTLTAAVDIALASADIRAGGDVTLTATAGDLNQTLGNDVFAGGDITVTTGGDQNLALLWSGGAVTLVAGGSILDNNDSPGTLRLNVRALLDSSFTAGGVIGVPNCLEIDIRGSLTVSAGGEIGGESICLIGRIDGGLIVVPTPPGEVDFTEVTAQPDQEPKRPDPIIQVPLLDTNIWPPRLVEMTVRKRPIPTKNR
jgi:filamentous hemagglutinin family protein